MSVRASIPLLILFAALSTHCQGSRSGKEEGDKSAATPAKEEDDGQSGPRFTAERVEVTLSEGRVAVHGCYTFHMPGQRPWRGRIGYPILVDAEQKAPAVVQLDGKARLPVRCRTSTRCAAVFSLGLAAGETRTVSVDYEQQISGYRVSYLIVSARRWKRPLEHAEFVVRIPATWRHVDLSYPVDEKSVEGDQRTLRFERSHFRPEGDLVVTWSE